MAKTLSIQVISVQVVLVDGLVYLVDSQGRRLTTGADPEKVAKKISSRTIHRMRWRASARAMAHAGNHVARIIENPPDAWQRKCQAISSGLSLRKRSLPSKAKRRSWDKFKTTTWDEAVERMWFQASNSFRYHTATPWEKWARTVAKNHNRKAEYRSANGRTANDQDCNGQTDHEPNRKAGFQMCIEWNAA